MHEDGEKIDFFPVNKALRLEKNAEDETRKELDELKAMVTKVLSKFEKQVRIMIHVDFMKSSGSIVKSYTNVYVHACIACHMCREENYQCAHFVH